MNKTNEEIVEEFQIILQNEFIHRDASSFDRKITFIEKALEAKGDQCRQEKIELVESGPFNLIPCAGNEELCNYDVCAGCEAEKWKEEKLNQLKG